MGICAIVGVGPRVGLGLSRAFAKNGDDIVMISRDTANTAPFAAELSDAGVSVHRYAMDATDRETTELVVHQIKGDVGVPDVVIYNPAVMAEIPYSTVKPSDIDEALQVMLYAPMNVVHSFLPMMQERGSGSILFTGGGFGVLPSVKRAPHSIGKAALRNYAYGLYLELKDQGIHAGTVTVHRPIEAGEDMERCVQTFVQLASEPAGEWTWERDYGN